ncbi:MAG: hypothetical protein MSN12_14375 [Bacteroides stercoris]|nr:hypothetical protein [Bacteroides stercoris]
MEENKQDILRIHIENSQPVEVADFTKTMNAFGALFASFAQKNGKSKEEANAKLYVSKIIEGSIDIHLVELATMGIIPFVENSNLILDFAKHIKSIYDYYVKGSSFKPELTPADLRNVHDMVSVPANDRNGVMSVQVIRGNVDSILYSGCTFNYIEGNGIQNKSDYEQKEIRSVSDNGDVYKKQLMAIYQVREGEGVGNKAIIDAISSKALALLFDSKVLEDEILRSEINPIKSAYYVDVMILTAQGRPAAYKVMALHDIISLDE